MDIKKTGFALVLVMVISGCASTTGLDKPGAAGESDIAPASDPAHGADTLTAAEKDDADPDEVICKRMVKVGTRIPSRQCATRAEWDAVEAGSQQVTEELQRKSSTAR